MLDLNDKRIKELEKTIEIKEDNLQYFNERNEFYGGYVIMIKELKCAYKEMTGISYEERMRDKEREKEIKREMFWKKIFGDYR